MNGFNDPDVTDISFEDLYADLAEVKAHCYNTVPLHQAEQQLRSHPLLGYDDEMSRQLTGMLRHGHTQTTTTVDAKVNAANEHYGLERVPAGEKGPGGLTPGCIPVYEIRDINWKVGTRILSSPDLFNFVVKTNGKLRFHVEWRDSRNPHVEGPYTLFICATQGHSKRFQEKIQAPLGVMAKVTPDSGNAPEFAIHATSRVSALQIKRTGHMHAGERVHVHFACKLPGDPDESKQVSSLLGENCWIFLDVDNASAQLDCHLSSNEVLLVEPPIAVHPYIIDIVDVWSRYSILRDSNVESEFNPRVLALINQYKEILSDFNFALKPGLVDKGLEELLGQKLVPKASMQDLADAGDTMTNRAAVPRKPPAGAKAAAPALPPIQERTAVDPDTTKTEFFPIYTPPESPRPCENQPTDEVKEEFPDWGDVGEDEEEDSPDDDTWDKVSEVNGSVASSGSFEKVGSLSTTSLDSFEHVEGIDLPFDMWKE